MKHKRMSQCLARGFALPTILIASVVMMIVLVSAVTAVSSSNSLLANQYYNQLAREAAESGLANVKICMVYTNYNPTWTDANPLKPDKDCTGVNNNGADPYVLNTGNIRTTFRVSAAQAGAAGTLRVVSTGIVQLVRSSNSSQVWRTFQVSVAQTTRYNDTPQIAGGAGWKSNGHNGYMLATNGTLYGWGDNTNQQLGDAALGATISKPIQMTLPTGVARVKKVFNSGQGASIVCILATNDTLGDQAYCRGVPGGGESGGLMPVNSPGWYRFGLSAGLTAVDMVVNGFGGDTACVLASDNQAYCAGMNAQGVLGNAATIGTGTPITAPTKFRLDIANPGPVSGSASSLTVKKIYNQDTFTCVIASDDQAYCAGQNDYGQLGHGNTTTNNGGGYSIPGRALIPGSPAVLEVVMSYHGAQEGVFYRTSDGTIYMSGHSVEGTARDGTFNTNNVYSTPRAITWSGFGRILSIGEQGGDQHAICSVGISANSPDSSMWCLGQNSYGELGTGSCSALSDYSGYSPVAGQKVNYQMNAQATYQMNSLTVITDSGDAYSAGDNTYGKLGTNGTLQACNSTFTKVQLPSGVKATAVANGDEYTTFILGDNGRVYAMGRNNNGQLGNGTTTDSKVPVEVLVPRQETVY